MQDQSLAHLLDVSSDLLGHLRVRRDLWHRRAQRFELFEFGMHALLHHADRAFEQGALLILRFALALALATILGAEEMHEGVGDAARATALALYPLAFGQFTLQLPGGA